MGFDNLSCSSSSLIIGFPRTNRLYTSESDGANRCPSTCFVTPHSSARSRSSRKSVRFNPLNARAGTQRTVEFLLPTHYQRALEQLVETFDRIVALRVDAAK